MSKVLLESQIRDLAYSKWESAGCPFITCEDERNRFWYEAEKELTKPAKPAKPAKPCKATKATDEKMKVKSACDFETTQAIPDKSCKNGS